MSRLKRSNKFIGYAYLFAFVCGTLFAVHVGFGKDDLPTLDLPPQVAHNCVEVVPEWIQLCLPFASSNPAMTCGQGQNQEDCVCYARNESRNINAPILAHKELPSTEDGAEGIWKTAPCVVFLTCIWDDDTGSCVIDPMGSVDINGPPVAKTIGISCEVL